MGTRIDDRSDAGVEFTFEGDLVTARNLESGVAASGKSKAEALMRLSEALELHEGGGEPIEDEGAFLREISLDPEDIDEDETPPPWLS